MSLLIKCVIQMKKKKQHIVKPYTIVVLPHSIQIFSSATGRVLKYGNKNVIINTNKCVKYQSELQATYSKSQHKLLRDWIHPWIWRFLVQLLLLHIKSAIKKRLNQLLHSPPLTRNGSTYPYFFFWLVFGDIKTFLMFSKQKSIFKVYAVS